MIWSEGEEQLKDFISYLNSIHANIKFSHEYSNSSHQTLPFLDVQVHLNSNNHIQTDLHTKPIDKHQYLLKTSCHTNHTKQTIPFSLSCETVAYALPTLSLTNEAKNSSSTWSNVVIAAIPYKRCKSCASHPTSRNTIATRTEATKTDRTPFVISFYPALSKILSIVKKHINILQTSANCKQDFPHRPVIAYKRNASLRDLLVHSTLKQALQSTTH